jgi:ribulose-5-phosphate 4-epimerase/fuculose-1-phosphate aldolase
MSHAMIYRACPEAQVAIHVHDLAAWERLLHRVPTTDNSASYGSPEMARSILDLFAHTDLRELKLFVMEGHREGIFAFGEDFSEAMEVLRKYDIVR